MNSYEKQFVFVWLFISIIQFLIPNSNCLTVIVSSSSNYTSVTSALSNTNNQVDNLQIIIEPGTYQETGSITWNYQNLIFFGNSTIPEDVRLNCISTSNSFLTIYSSFSISNITFSQCGQIISTSKQYTIYSISIDNCVFENNSNSYPNYLISLNNVEFSSQTIAISNSIFRSNYGSILYINYGVSFTITGCIFENNFSNGYAINLYTTVSIIFSQCNFFNWNSNSYSAFYDAFSRNLQIQNCNFVNYSKNSSIEVYGTQSLSITGNYFSNCNLYAISLYSTPSIANIQNNIFANNGRAIFCSESQVNSNILSVNNFTSQSQFWNFYCESNCSYCPGCDGISGSNTTYDICGNCGGNNVCQTTDVLFISSANSVSTSSHNSVGTTSSQLISGGPKSSAVIPIAVSIVVVVVLLIVVLLILFIIFRKRRSPHSVLEVRLSQLGSIELRNITLGKRLGSGNFGDVYIGNWKNATVAVKTLKNFDDIDDILKEVEIFQKLNHPHVLRMYGFYNDKEVGYCIVMEFMEEGSLDKFLLSNRGKFEVKHFVDFSFQISLGMVYLSSEKIIHRDLALRNILVSSKKDRYIVKISDFGLSRQTSAYRISDSKLPVKWSAPETYLKHESTIKSDVWSFGIVLWEIFCEGLEPYTGMSSFEVIQKVPEGIRLPPPKNCPEEVINLMNSCWQLDPANRPSFDVISSILKSNLSPETLLLYENISVISFTQSRSQTYSEVYN